MRTTGRLWGGLHGTGWRVWRRQPEAWIERDAAFCFLVIALFDLDYLETPGQGGERVLWGVDNQVDRSWQIDACDGSLFRSFIYEPF